MGGMNAFVSCSSAFLLTLYNNSGAFLPYDFNPEE